MNQMLSISCRVTQLNSLEAGGRQRGEASMAGFSSDGCGGEEGGGWGWQRGEASMAGFSNDGCGGEEGGNGS